MIAFDPDTDDSSALKYVFVEPITAVDKYGKEVTDSAILYKVSITFFNSNAFPSSHFIFSTFLYYLINSTGILWD